MPRSTVTLRRLAAALEARDALLAAAKMAYDHMEPFGENKHVVSVLALAIAKAEGLEAHDMFKIFDKLGGENRELANLIKANPGRWPELEDTQPDAPAPGRVEPEKVVAIGIATLVAGWLVKRAVKLALWASAVAAVGAYAYLAYNPLCAVGVATLILAVAMAICPSESVPGRINAALTSAFWMVFAVFTAGAALHRLGHRHLRGGGIFAHVARALIAAIVLSLLYVLGVSTRAHAWKDCKSGLCAENSVERAAKHTCSATCRKDNGGPCQRCLEERTACVVTIIKKVPMMTGSPDEDLSPYGETMSMVGEHYPVTGASTLKWLCQHGGFCVSTDAVRFDRPCVYKSGEGWEKR
jgi:hypothetical protein